MALVEELGVQLGRLRGAGPKIRQFVSMVGLDRRPEVAGTLGALPEGARAVPFGRVRRVIEQELGDRVTKLFADIDEQPFALASLGQVHRARTREGEELAVKVQHAGVAEAVAGDLRNLGIVGPIIKRLAPGLDASGVLAELRERISEELDYEHEAQHQRRLERRFRGHPHVRVPRPNTELSTRRVLVSEYVEGLAIDDVKRLDQGQRDRLGEIAFRFFFGLVWRDHLVAGDPHPDNCLLCPDGRLALLDYGLLRDLDADYLAGERDLMRAVAEGDSQSVHDGVARLGYLPERESFAPDALLELIANAGQWLLSPSVRRLDRDDVSKIVEKGYPPGSPSFALMRRLSVPPPTLLLRRMELQLLALLGELGAAADWGAISAEHHSTMPPSTALGREDHAFFTRR